MQERFDKYAADYAGFAAEGQPAEGMMWSVTGMQYEQGPEVAEGEILAAERKKQREVMEAVEVPTRKKDGGAAKGKGVEGSTASPGSAAAPSAHRVVSDEAVPISAVPQYKYQTPVEDPKLARAVLD